MRKRLIRENNDLRELLDQRGELISRLYEWEAKYKDHIQILQAQNKVLTEKLDAASANTAQAPDLIPINPDEMPRMLGIGALPTVHNRTHESAYRCYHVLAKVKELLADGVPGPVILEMIEVMEYLTPQPTG